MTQMKILSLGLPRTGSKSIAEALKILGYRNVHHGTELFGEKEQWALLGRALDGTFPVLSTYNNQPFTKENWDEMFGSYEVATDVASIFAPQLIRTYPEAKVILAIRDFEPWSKSIDESCCQPCFSLLADIVVRYAEPLLGLSTGQIWRRILFALFDAQSRVDMPKNARMIYERHNRQIREMVPPSQLLVYRIRDGWGPLCAFLGKPVPDVEFPRVNDSAEMKRAVNAHFRLELWSAARLVLSRSLAAGLVGLLAWYVGGHLKRGIQGHYM